METPIALLSVAHIECRIKFPQNQRCRAKIARHPPKPRCRTFLRPPLSHFPLIRSRQGARRAGGEYRGAFGRLIFIHLRCWEVLPFLTIQRQRCIKILCPKDPEFYTPLALNRQKGQHLPAPEVYKNQSPSFGSRNYKGVSQLQSGTEKGVITKGVFSPEKSLESLKSLKSLNSLESLEDGRNLLCFPQSGGSLESLESLNSLESLENGLFWKDPFSKRPLFPIPIQSHQSRYSVQLSTAPREKL